MRTFDKQLIQDYSPVRNLNLSNRVPEWVWRHAMSISITVRNGTAVGQESLCRTCRHAHIQQGYSESEEEIRCGYFYEGPRLVPFAVNQCTDYLSKLAPTLYEMEKMAFVIDVKKVNPRAGFGGATTSIRKPEEGDE